MIVIVAVIVIGVRVIIRAMVRIFVLVWLAAFMCGSRGLAMVQGVERLHGHGTEPFPHRAMLRNKGTAELGPQGRPLEESYSPV